MASLDQLTVGIPGAGRRTLLAALQGTYELPEDFRLCVLDAERLNEPSYHCDPDPGAAAGTGLYQTGAVSALCQSGPALPPALLADRRGGADD